MKTKLFAILCLLIFGLASLPRATGCMSRAEAEQALESYLMSYAAREGALVPNAQAREEMIANLMCLNAPLPAPSAPVKPAQYETELSRNSTHIFVEVHALDMAGKPFVYTTARPIQSEAQPEPQPEPAAPQAAPQVTANQTSTLYSISAIIYLGDRVTALEKKLAALCAKGIVEAC